MVSKTLFSQEGPFSIIKRKVWNLSKLWQVKGVSKGSIPADYRISFLVLGKKILLACVGKIDQGFWARDQEGMEVHVASHF